MSGVDLLEHWMNRSSLRINWFNFDAHTPWFAQNFSLINVAVLTASLKFCLVYDKKFSNIFNRRSSRFVCGSVTRWVACVCPFRPKSISVAWNGKHERNYQRFASESLQNFSHLLQGSFCWSLSAICRRVPYYWCKNRLLYLECPFVGVRRR